MKRVIWLIVSIICLAGCSTTTQPERYPTIAPGPVMWGSIQQSADELPEAWHWELVDAQLQPLLTGDSVTVVPIWPYALWDQATCHADWPSQVSLLHLQLQAPYPPCDQAAYEAWLQALVQRYSSDNIIWQMVAAPDLQTAPLANFIGTADSYSSLALSSIAAIRAVQPNAQITLGALSNTEPDSVTFFSEVLRSDLNTANVSWAIDANVEQQWSVPTSMAEQANWQQPLIIVYTDSE